MLAHCTEDIWLKDERFDPIAPFEPDRVVLYAPKGCILDTIPGVSLILSKVQTLDRPRSSKVYRLGDLLKGRRALLEIL